jgi:chitinase
MLIKINSSVVFLFLLLMSGCVAQEESPTASPFRIVGYYAGPPDTVDSFDVSKLTHLIFSFGHLDGNHLKISSAADTTTIEKMVRMKSINPDMKVMLSLGGWGGCETCSDVFNSAAGREEFATSLKELSTYFKTDGIDLDWEYPAIAGYPGHTYRVEDRHNFTLLLKELRRVNGEDFEISFAAGGFTTFMESCIEWKDVIKYTDFINIMTYDLVHGYSKTSGHHTPLYSTPQQAESTDNAVKLLLQAGVPAEQIVIGAAFYGRFFEIAAGNPVDLYSPCHFLHGFSSKYMVDSIGVEQGFETRWDSVAQAPYAINTERRILATYDNGRSMALKTRYAVDKKLGGIMFWQLMDDRYQAGLLDTIYMSK